MRRADAQKLFDLLAASATDDISVTVRGRGRKLRGFHDWADGKPLVGDLEVVRGGTTWRLLFIEWNESLGYYVVVYPGDRQAPRVEIHELVGTRGDRALRWRYKPAKRDGKNAERVAYFEHTFRTRDVLLSLPSAQEDGAAFLDELLLLVENRLAADALAGTRPADRESFPEGRTVERRHLDRERKPQLVADAKARALELHGKLACEVCAFDFETKYGVSFIEAHHTRPLSDGERETRVEDLALVCANCHRMLHRRRPWLTMEHLGELLVVERRARPRSTGIARKGPAT